MIKRRRSSTPDHHRSAGTHGSSGTGRALSRSVLYFAGYRGINYGIARLVPASARWAWPIRAYVRVPVVTLWTRLLLPHPQTWGLRPRDQEVRHIMQGGILGSIVALSWFGVATACGWVRWGAWGWRTTPPVQLAKAVALMITADYWVAWREELVYRGAGLDLTTAALGPRWGRLGITLSFALGHRRGPHRLIGYSAAGLALLSLRDTSGTIWLPLGYHWAWNAWQTAIFGPPAALPSLRPVHVCGPDAWVGRPGQPEPGWLSTIMHLVIAAGSVLWHRRLVIVR